ncbi:MAG: hypothetical protein DI526_01440 [Caulobacter segnis]|uniref:Uncharacterized protein n=1 Tax=Caulobacter segnis TaxID=88688 RepID=A0A2W5WSS0_9CAUL|nr:MAG: hypothetical protein DI526_01440 [Caulobacter segnis]
MLDRQDREGLALVAVKSGVSIAAYSGIRELLRLAALGAWLEEHVKHQAPVPVVRGLYDEFGRYWPKETP